MQSPGIWIAAAVALIALGLTGGASANDRHGGATSQEMMDQDAGPRAGAPDMMDMMRKMERMMRRLNRIMHAMGTGADEDDGRGHGMGHGGAAERGGGAHAMMDDLTGRGPEAAHVGPRSGARVTRIEHLSVADVRHFLEHHLRAADNKRLRIGAVEAADDDTITAVIETIEGSLVQRFSVDRHTGRLTKTE